MTHLLLSLLLRVGVQDQLEGAEIGDRVQAMTFATDGKYSAERKDKAGKTVAKGAWKVDGDRLEVKVTSCKGPACKTFGQSFGSDIVVMSDRAMEVKTAPANAPFDTGSYYCHYLGCEKRVGVELVMHRGKGGVMRYLLDYLIQKNHGREVTVVWWGKRNPSPQPKTRITYCRREEARNKAGAEGVAKDLAELAWVGATAPEPGDAVCLFDVRVDVGDGAVLPPELTGTGRPSP